MDQKNEFNFLRYGLALWRRRWMIIAVTIVALSAAFVATRLGAGEADDAEEVVVADVYRTTITIAIDGASALPSNPALALIGVGGEGNRGLAAHVQLMRSRNVLERAAAKLRADPETADDIVVALPTVSDADQLDEPASPLSIAAELDLEIDALESDVTVRALTDSDLIEVVARAGDPLVAKARAEAIIAAYLDFLVDDEFGSINDALETVKQKIDEIELSTIVTPEVLTLFTILSKELDQIADAVESGGQDLLVLESDISTAVRESIGEQAITGEQAEELSSIERGLEILRATADSVAYASGEIELVFGEFSKAEFDAFLSAQIGTLEETTSALEAVSKQISLIHGQILSVNELESENAIELALAEDVRGYELAQTEIDRTIGQLDLVGTAVIGTGGQSLRLLLDTLKQTITAVSTRLAGAIQDAETNDDSEVARQAMIDEAIAASSSLNVIADELTLIRRGEDVQATDQGYMLAAEARLRTATAALETVTRSRVQSSVTFGTGQLLQILQQLTAVTGAGDAVVFDVKRAIADNSVGTSDRELISQQLRATSSVLSGVNAVTRNVRSSQTDGTIFAQLVSVEAQINTISVGLQTSSPALARFGNGAAAEKLDSLRSELSGALVVTNQLLERSVSQIATGESGKETQKLMEDQIETGAVLLLTAASQLEDVRGLDVPGTNAGSLIGLEARLRGLSDGLFALVQSSTARERLASIGTTAVDAAQLIRAVNAETELEDARDSVAEIGVRLTIASREMAEASSEVQELADRDALSGDTNLALVSQRVQSAGTRLSSLTSRLPQIEGGTTAGSESLQVLRGELEILLLRPQETSFTRIGESTNLVFNPGSFLDIAGEGADLKFLLGAVAGLLLGIIAAIALEAVDRSIKGPNDVKPVKRLVPLGVVARGASKGNPYPPEVHDIPGSIFSESVQLLINTVEKRLGDDTKTIVITSPVAREGKTMLALNLARTFGLRGKSVLLIDANIRKPDSSKILDVLEVDGLANVLAGEHDAQDLIVHQEGLDVLPAGNSVIMPVELLSRSEMSALLRRFEQIYDFVIVDAPPILGFSDTAALAKQAGAVVLVVRSGKSKLAEIEESSETLENAGVKVVGAVVNFVKPKTLNHLAHDKYSSSTSGSKWLSRVPFDVGGKFPFSRKWFDIGSKFPFSRN